MVVKVTTPEATETPATSFFFEDHSVLCLPLGLILVSSPEDESLTELSDRIEIQAQLFGGPQDPKVLGAILNKVRGENFAIEVTPDYAPEVSITEPEAPEQVARLGDVIVELDRAGREAVLAPRRAFLSMSADANLAPSL